MLSSARTAGNRCPMADPNPGPPAKPVARPRRRLLLVDDNGEGRRALARLLQLYGFDVTAVADGTSALSALRDDPAPDVVLTDLLLPDADGRDIAARARTLSPAPLVILITGWDFGEAPEPSEANADLVFLKPLNVAELVQNVDQLRPAGA